MPAKRRPDQRMISFHLDLDLGGEMERVRRKQGKSRSQFLREAIVEKLQGLGVHVDPALALARDRAGNYLVAEEINGDVHQTITHHAPPSEPIRYKQRRKKK